MRHPNILQPKSSRGHLPVALQAAARLVLMAGLIGTIAGAVSPAQADDVVLLVDNGPNPGDVALSWTGGQVTYQVFRAGSPASVVSPGNKLGETNATTWPDTPPAGSVFYIITDGLDRVPPTISATPSPQPNAAGWNKTDVQVSFTCSDAGSGIATCPSPVTVSTEAAGQVVSGTATDNEGNSATTSITLNIDKTAPTLTITAPVGTVASATSPEVDVRYTDALSHVAPSTLVVSVDDVPIANCSAAAAAAACQPPPLASGGHAIAAGVSDIAGNPITASSTFTHVLDNPPVIAPIGDKTAALGQTLTFTLQVSDADDDPLTLMAAPLPLPDHVTFEGTTGVFTFRPAADQTGSFPVTFTVSDGKVQVSQAITVTVPAPSPTAPTTLEGYVLDANSYANQVTTPIVGATISLLGTNRSAVSDAQGHFVITDAAPEQQVLDIAPGMAQPAPDGSPYGGFREAIRLIPNVTNTIERPFFLPRIAMGSLKTIDANATTVVTNSNLQVSISVPPHTAKNANGSDFIGDMSISLVPRGLAPAPLPANLDPGLLVTIQPVGVFFAAPVPMTFPNLDNAPAGSSYDLWSLLASEGRFAVVGKAVVSANGQSVTTISGGVRAADWHTVEPITPLPDPVGHQDCPPDTCCAECPGGSSIPYHDGGLLEDYETPGVRSLGVNRSIRVAYRSTTADVKPIIAQDVLLSQTSAVPEMISVYLGVGGVQQASNVFFDSSTLSETSDSVSRLPVQVDASALPTGRYPYTEFITSHYPSNGVTAAVEGHVTIVNQRQSPIGAGWGIAGLQRLKVQHRIAFGYPGGAAATPIESTVITDGNGAAQVFEPADFGVFAPAQSMTTARSYAAAAVMFSNKKVLVTGGISASNTILSSAEVYDPATGTWTPTSGAMTSPRYGHTATTLRDGRVLIVGGFKTSADLGSVSGNIAGQAEIYDPATGTFTTTGSTLDDRAFHTATLLGTGEVLIAGADTNFRAELYNPATGLFRYTHGNMHGVRYFTTATLLPDGRVFFAGGQGVCQQAGPDVVASEMFDPFTEQFTGVGAMARTRVDHAAALLPDGKVLLAGGVDADACQIGNVVHNTAEIMDPVTGTTTLLADTLCSPKSSLRAVALRSGKVLLTGGYSAQGSRVATQCADLYDPNTGRITRAPDMLAARAGHIAISLPTIIESVLVTGGYNDPFPAISGADRFGVDALTQGSSFISPPGDFSTLTRNFDGTFVRTYKDQTRVDFDVDGLETSVTDRNGNITQFEYDAQQRLETMTDPMELPWTLAYGSDGTLQSITDPANRATLFTHDLQGNLTQIIKADNNSIGFAYDAEHRMIQKTDERGKVIQYAYDFAGRFASATHPEGEVRRLTPSEVVGLPNPALGEGTSANPALIVLTQDVEAVSTNGNGHETRFRVNGFGSALKVIDPLGRITQSTLNEDNQPTQIIRPNQSVVTRTYDGKGNLRISTEENDRNGPATTTYTYEPVFNQVDSITDQRNHRTTIGHDTHGNPTTITDAREKVSHLGFDSRGLLTSISNPLEETVTFEPDSQGNTHIITDARLKQTILTRDTAGNVTDVYDPLQHHTHTDYDSLGRVMRVTDPLQGVTRYDYDEAGNLVLLTDAKNHATKFEYNDRNLLASTTNALDQKKSYFYDAARNLDHIIDAKGQRIEFPIYDDAEQLKTKVLKGDTGSITDTVNYDYDLLGNLSSTSDSDSGLVFTYDPLGQLETASTTAGPAQPATTIHYTYDEAGNRHTMTDPHNNLTTYEYDTVNRLTDIINNLDGHFTFGYDDANRRTSLLFPNTTSAAYGYDAAGNLETLHYLDSTPALLSKSDYHYDDKGNRDTRTTLDGITTYDYDDLGRLKGAAGPDPANPAQTATESYDYDAVGNRTSSHLATGQQHDVANRLLEDSKFVYGHDANGNLTSKQDKITSALTNYDWDVENRLTAVHTPAQTVTFRYDPLGRRIEKAGSTTRRYLYDQEDIVEELDGNNTLQTRYKHGSGIDEPLARRDVPTGTTAYYIIDGLGSVTNTTDVSSQVVSTRRYDSYGNLASEATLGGYAFTSREWDPETGLYYYRARYYDAATGRFIQEDPIGFRSQQVNFFQYANDEPVGLHDPFGLKIQQCFRPLRWPWKPLIIFTVVSPPVPTNTVCPMHEYLFDTDTGTSHGFDPREDRPETGSGVCYDVPEPIGSCAFAIFDAVKSCGKYELLGNNCQSTVERAIERCRQMNPQPPPEPSFHTCQGHSCIDNQ